MMSKIKLVFQIGIIFLRNTIEVIVLYTSLSDQRFVVRKCPALLQEMINVGCQLNMMANSRGGASTTIHIVSLSHDEEKILLILTLVFVRFYTLTHIPLCRVPRSSAGNHRELYEADPDDSAGPAGVKVATASAASL